MHNIHKLASESREHLNALTCCIPQIFFFVYLLHSISILVQVHYQLISARDVIHGVWQRNELWIAASRGCNYFHFKNSLCHGLGSEERGDDRESKNILTLQSKMTSIQKVCCRTSRAELRINI